VATLSHLRKLNGIIKKLGKRKPYIRSGSSSAGRYACLLSVLWIGGCTSLKKAAIVGTASLTGASVASVFSSGALVPAAVGAASASAASAYVDQSMKSAKGDNMLTSASCAPDNFWTLLGDLVGMGGWFLILLFVVPMLLGWILPGPLEGKKKKKK